jgi:hypothetical protein
MTMTETVTDMTVTAATLEQFRARADQLTKIYLANPQQFATEREAVTRAEGTRDVAKRDAKETITLRETHTRLIHDAHKAGALLDSERTTILDRYNTAYATPNVEDAQQVLDEAWMSFWNVLKQAEREQLQGQPTTA